jgi:hypothetical protein
VIWHAPFQPRRPAARIAALFDPGKRVGELAFHGATLWVRRGERVDKFDLAAADTRVSLHMWGFMRGTVLRIVQGPNEATVAGDRYTSLGSEYSRQPIAAADVVLSREQFEDFHGALSAACHGSDPSHSSAGPDKDRIFLLWPNGYARSIGLRYALGLLGSLSFILGGTMILPRPLRSATLLLVAIALLWLSMCWIWFRENRRRGRPALCLTVRDGVLTVEQIDPPLVLGRCSIQPGQACLTKWRPPLRMREAISTVYLPALEIEAQPSIRLSIGCPLPAAECSGHKVKPPRYLVHPAWWPLLVEALVRRVEQRPGPGPYRV